VVEDGISYKQVTIRVNYKGVVLRGMQDGSTIGTKDQFVVSEGQFILSRIDARNGAFGIIPEELEGAIVTNDFLAFDINKDEVEQDFFNLFLQSPIFLEACIKASRGNTNRKRVEEEFFLNYQVNLPPLTQQHRLLKQINKGRTQILTAQAEIARQRSLLAKLKQAILQEAIQGKLTADWREAHPQVEPASQLLHRIQAEKARLIAAKKLRPEKLLSTFTSAGVTSKHPESWAFARLGDIANVVRGGSPRPAGDPRFYGGTIPFLKVADLTNDDEVYVQGYAFTINEAGLSNTRFVDEELVLLTNSGATLGVPKILNFPAAFNDGIAAFLCLPKDINRRFLFYFLKAKTTWFLAEVSKGIGQPNLNTDLIKQTSIAIPPLSEQLVIVDRVAALMTACKEVEASIEESSVRASNLLQAILKEAFAPGKEAPTKSAPTAQPADVFERVSSAL
jgi:type I restriction enzyme S subunit